MFRDFSIRTVNCFSDLVNLDYFTTFVRTSVMSYTDVRFSKIHVLADGTDFLH